MKKHLIRPLSLVLSCMVLGGAAMSCTPVGTETSPDQTAGSTTAGESQSSATEIPESSGGTVESPLATGDTQPPSQIVHVDGDIFNNPNAKMLGGTVCDYLQFKLWYGGFIDANPLQVMKENGFNWVRVGVLMKEDETLDGLPYDEWNTVQARGWSTKPYAKRILKEASDVGLMKNLFFFLSDTAASGAEQNAPYAWKNLSVEETAEKLEEYCFETTKYFIDDGIKIDLYELGNENERGILNFRPDERIERPADVNVLTNITWMRENVWTIQAELFRAAIQGIRRADPDAKIGIHGSCFGYADNMLILGFFEAMINYGVDYDVASASYYWRDIHADFASPRSPKEAYWTTREWRNTLQRIEAMDKIFILGEIQYPFMEEAFDAAPDIGYPYTQEGQANWLYDLLTYVGDTPGVAGTIYFYPDYYDNMASGYRELNMCGLFTPPPDFGPLPGMLAYRRFADEYVAKMGGN